MTSFSCYLTFVSSVFTNFPSLIFSLFSLPFTISICLCPCLSDFLSVSLPYCTSEPMETRAELTSYQLVQIISGLPQNAPESITLAINASSACSSSMVCNTSRFTSSSALVYMLTDNNKPSHTEMKLTMYALWQKWALNISRWLPLVRFSRCITFMYFYSSQKSWIPFFFSSLIAWTLHEATPDIISQMNHVPSPTSSSSASINLLFSWNEKFPGKTPLLFFVNTNHQLLEV